MNVATRMLWAVAILARAAAADPSEAPTPGPLAITHVTVVDTREGIARPDMTVWVRDGRISRVDRDGATVAGATVVDGRGKFLIPGLWDAHVHLSSATASALPVLVANGITAVRDCGGDLSQIDA